ncbi:translocation protein Sec62-domain-containing protein [Pyronema domesticum]|nr:translocation protein Sec62-domain-containing protein [Pyronema domesticum]
MSHHGHSHGGQAGGFQPQPASAPPPPPEAIAIANFLKGHSDLKARTCIYQGGRKDIFKVKRALRLLESPAYAKAQAKNPALPKITSRDEAVHAFAHLPRSLLALRIAKIEEEGPKSPKRVKGQWNIKVEPQQEIHDDLYYAWFYEPKTWTQTLSSVGLVIALFTIVLFPLWPPMLRLGVWYLSMGMLGLIGLFMIMSVFRLILFLVTMVALSPGIWLYPNLFEDVGFFDSFRPLWAWHKVKKPKVGKKEKAAAAPMNEKRVPRPAGPPPGPRIEEVDEE